MTDQATDAPETPSTVLTPDAPAQVSGGGAPAPEAKEPAPLSLRDVIAEESKKSEAPADDAKAADDKPAPAEDGKAEDKAAKGDDADKPEAKAKPADDVKKPDRAEDGKFAPKKADDADSKRSDADEAEDKARGRIDPPKNFLPDAKETWRNTPRAVQRDVERLAQTYESEVTQLRERTQRYEQIREYDELARSNGRDLRESLERISAIEDQLQANPIAGLNAILREAGPRKADGSPVSLFEVASWIVQQGEAGYQRVVAAAPANDQRQQANPEVEQLKAQIAQMQQQQVASSVIEPFKASHPRYEELAPHIATILKSGMVPTDLSTADRLAVAYDMAERLNPPSHDDKPASTAPSPDADGRADPSGSSGTKSIKSAPGSVSLDHAPERGGSIRDVLASEVKRQRRA